jgi:hypothetical protein
MKRRSALALTLVVLLILGVPTIVAAQVNGDITSTSTKLTSSRYR